MLWWGLLFLWRNKQYRVDTPYYMELLISTWKSAKVRLNIFSTSWPLVDDQSVLQNWWSTLKFGPIPNIISVSRIKVLYTVFADTNFTKVIFRLLILFRALVVTTCAWCFERHFLILCIHVGKNFSRRHFGKNSYFSQKIGFDISCKLSPMETVCMQCQSLIFWQKNEHNIG